MVRVMGKAIIVMWCLLLVLVLGWQGAWGQEGRPREYSRQDVILTLARADMEFTSDDYDDAPGDGTFVYSVGGILGGERTFWLVRDGLWEYDLEGNLVGIIPFPAPNKLGWTKSYLASSEGIYLLQDRGWDWRSDETYGLRLSYQFYAFGDRRWLGPIPVPDVDEFKHDLSMPRLTARRGVVLIADAGKNIGVAISTEGRHCDPVSRIDVQDLGRCRVIVERAVNGWGFALARGGTRSGTADTEYLIIDPSGAAVGRLVEKASEVWKQQLNREDTPQSRWAILADGSVLQLEVSIRGEPADAIQVVRWTP